MRFGVLSRAVCYSEAGSAPGPFSAPFLPEAAGDLRFDEGESMVN